MHRVTWATLIALTTSASADAADWPMFRADAARSGYTSERLPTELGLRWVYRASQAPQPAWPTRNRLAFDHAAEVVVAGDTLYFGSSVDTKVYALDAASGDVRWTFFTDGPVRFAPVVWRDRLLVASDDGYLYCLSAATGELIWKRRGGPRTEMLLGNDRMISRWPARGGPVAVGDVVYFGAGIWPSEGIFLYALDAATGSVLWQNDSSGTIEMNQPHGTARAKSGLSAQGYLAACNDGLLVPTGRAVPAILNLADGSLRHFQLQVNQHAGGADVVAIDDHFANSGVLYAMADVWMGYQAAHQASRDSEVANRMAAFRADDGSRAWDIQAEYADRPVFIGSTIYAPPSAWDLSTGRKLPLSWERSYGCGIVAGCPGMLVFRSATLGYIDLATSMETQNYGGIRPGCWIAGIPAGGVLAMPDAASWCTCSYLNQGTMVLRSP